MEHFRQLVAEANKAFQTADHLAFVTYPFVNDVKILMIIAENLQKALLRGMEALLYYDALYKRISPYPKEFRNQFDIFRNHTARRYNIPNDQLMLIAEVNDVVNNRNKSKVEFARRDQFVIATSDYRVKTINIEKIKNYINLTKRFIGKVNEVQEASDRRFS